MVVARSHVGEKEKSCMLERAVERWNAGKKKVVETLNRFFLPFHTTTMWPEECIAGTYSKNVIIKIKE